MPGRSLFSVCAAFARSAWHTAVLGARRWLRLSPEHVGLWLHFADGTRGRVYRETVNRGPRHSQPSLLVVAFRLRGVGHSRVAHRLFRAESLLNTPLFAGFPGFRSKLWLTDPVSAIYRGVYEWDGPEQATAYAQTLVKLLALVSVPGSVTFHVEPDVTPQAVLADPSVLGAAPADPAERWWRFEPAPPQ